MIIPEIRSITSPDLGADTLPADPKDCRILIELTIGPKGQAGEEIFSFEVVTPEYLRHEEINQCGRGLLITNEFSWSVVKHSAERLLAHASRKTWNEVAAELNKELHWEFENYRPYEKDKNG